MRIYEYAKKYKVTSKDLIKILVKQGFEVTSHMSVLDAKALAFLDKTLRQASAGVKAVAGKQVKKPAVPRQGSTEQGRSARDEGKEEKNVPKEVKKTVSPAMQKVKKAEGKPAPKVIEKPKKLVIRPMVLGDAAQEMGKPATGVILTLLKWGVVCAKNQVLPEELVEKLARHYEIDFERASSKELVEKVEKEGAAVGANQQERLPVVVVMGHVDHGKTTLLDFVRKTRVASREKGGITQHLGAYEVTTPQGGVVFLDTPGHEAFSKIRMRGAKAADIGILVVAADDSVMPQTIEVIEHAKSVKLPLIVAINKVDRVGPSEIEKVKQDLVRYELLPEEWGGDTVCVPISAKLGQGIDHLLEMIILQSQMMGLKADKLADARGYVLESKIEKGRGPVATLILQHGIARVGDFFVCGKTFGKINSMVDSYSKRVKSAEPSVPVQVAGFAELPEAGDFFEVVSPADYKKARQGKREQRPLAAKMVSAADKDSINLIIKADSDSSKEALLGAIEKASKNLEKGFNIIQASVGDISESDIDLASISSSLLVGLHVKAEAKASSMAQMLAVKVELFDIIYKLIEFLEEYSESKKEIKKELRKIGEAVVLRVFQIKNIGTIAGCAVKDGRFSKDGSVVVFRRGKKVGEGKISSLQREKKIVKEVHAGFECAFLIDGFSDWEVDDRVECYLELPQEK